mgnify:CR=1 FL=1
MTRARAKKLKESMQSLVCAIHDRVGHANIIQGLEEEETTRYTVIKSSSQVRQSWKIRTKIKTFKSSLVH